METQWYYTEQGQPFGPVSPEQLKELVKSGRLQPSDLVWKVGMAKWLAASQVKGLFPETTQAPVPAAPSPLLVVEKLSHTVQAMIPSVVSARQIGTCAWCAKELPSGAVNCPHCGNLRKDIYRDKVLSYVCGVLAVLPASFLVAGMVAGWWDVAAAPGPGHQFDAPTFSFGRFLSSNSGIPVLGSFAGCIFGYLHFVRRASRKLGKWTWY